MPSSCPCKTKCHCHHPRGKKKPGWLGSQRHNAPPSCSPTLDSPRDCRPREEQHPAGCTRKGCASGKESATSPPPPRPHLGSTGGRAGPAPGSSESGPPPYALRVPPAGLAALRRKPFALGAWLGLVLPRRAGSLSQGQALEFRLAMPLYFCFLSSQSQGTESVTLHAALGEGFITELYLQPCTLVFLTRK